MYWKDKGVLDFRFNLLALTENNSEVGRALPSFTNFEGDTLFLAGAKSDYISSDEEPLIKAHFPNSQIVIVPNTGHWLHAENPKDFYQRGDFVSTLILKNERSFDSLRDGCKYFIGDGFYF